MRRVIATLWSPRTITQFASVGVAGATVETSIVALLTISGDISPLAAKAVGAECSIIVMFLLNDRLTFAGEGANDRSTVITRWGRSHIVRIGGLVVAFAVLWLLTAQTTIQIVIAGADLWPTIANVIGIGLGMVLNYVGESLFTWEILTAERSHETNERRQIDDGD